MHVEPERGCFRRAADAHVHTHCASPEDQARRFLCACCDAHMACLAQDAPERARPQAGQAPLPQRAPSRAWGSPAAGRQASRQAAGHAQCRVPGHRHHGYLHIHCASHAAVPRYCCLEEQELIACLPGHCRGWWRAEALGQKPTKPRSCWRAGAGMQLDQRNQRALGPIHTTQGGCDCSL